MSGAEPTTEIAFCKARASQTLAWPQPSPSQSWFRSPRPIPPRTHRPRTNPRNRPCVPCSRPPQRVPAGSAYPASVSSQAERVASNRFQLVSRALRVGQPGSWHSIVIPGCCRTPLSLEGVPDTSMLAGEEAAALGGVGKFPEAKGGAGNHPGGRGCRSQAPYCGAGGISAPKPGRNCPTLEVRHVG